MKDLPIVKPGDGITAAWANALREAAMEGRIEAVPPLYLDTYPGGSLLSIDTEAQVVIFQASETEGEGTIQRLDLAEDAIDDEFNDVEPCEVILL